VKTLRSQMGSPAAAEGGGEAMGGGRGKSGESSEVHARSTLTSTAPKARSISKSVVESFFKGITSSRGQKVI